MYDVVLLTEDQYVSPSSPDWYAQQILDEDELVQQALEKHGLRVIRKAWSDQHFDWNSTRAALFRATWDYFHRAEEFSTWLDTVASQTRLINDIETIRWNMDKHYLADLQERGICIPPTQFIEAGTTTTLAELHRETGWTETVLKPNISGGARETYRLSASNLAAHEADFQRVLAAEAMMLQPFQRFVTEVGEYSLMVFGGQFTHAVLKVAKQGDYRVQDDWGGTVHPYAPSQEEIDFALEAVAACKPYPEYARVDMIRDNNGALAIIELELIEPELWFRMHPPAAHVLADSISRLLQ